MHIYCSQNINDLLLCYGFLQFNEKSNAVLLHSEIFYHIFYVSHILLVIIVIIILSIIF